VLYVSAVYNHGDFLLLSFAIVIHSDSDVISSYQLFSAILWGKLCEMFAILTSVDVTFAIRLR